MAVYTCFGDMGSLVREVVRPGYTGLAEEFDRVAWSADPVADLTLLCHVYRDVALVNPHLYAVMFGGRVPAGFRLTDEDRRLGQRAVGRLAECVARCVVTGRFRDTVAFQHLWLAVHGRVLLEIDGYAGGPADSFDHQLVSLMVGAGDAFEQAAASVRRAAALV
jgi:hypothetical protein